MTDETKKTLQALVEAVEEYEPRGDISGHSEKDIAFLEGVAHGVQTATHIIKQALLE